MAIIKNQGNYLGVNYDLAIYEDIVRDDRIFNLYPKKRYYEDSGIEIFSEDIKEYDNKKIILEPNTYNLEVLFTDISNIKALVLHSKVINLNSIYQPDFILKLDSIDADKIYCREFIHLGISDGLSKIYLSNVNEYKLEINIFVAGDTDISQYTPSNTFYKTDDSRVIVLKHSLGVIPIILCLNDDGTIFSDYTFDVNENEALITFSTDFKGRIVFQNNFTYNIDNKSSVILKHNLNKYPGILLSSEKNHIVVYNSENELTITFEEPFTGTIKLF